MSYFLANSLKSLRDEINSRWPNRSKISDGWIGDAAHNARKSDHNPDWTAPGNRRGVVRALDITANGIDTDLLLKHTTNDSRVAYVIHKGRIYTHARGWYKYNGSNPHNTHIHVSIGHSSSDENTTKTWISSSVSKPVEVKPAAPVETPKPVPVPVVEVKPELTELNKENDMIFYVWGRSRGRVFDGQTFRGYPVSIIFKQVEKGIPYISITDAEHEFLSKFSDPVIKAEIVNEKDQ